MREHWGIAITLVAFLSLGTLYSVVNPLFEAPDEVWHYEFVRWVATGKGLPVYSDAGERPWAQEGSQPPLYYLLGSLLTFWIDTRDAGEVIRYNPHAAPGRADVYGNVNMMAHTLHEAFPYQGTVLAAHVVRLGSVLLGAGTVLFTYLISLCIFPRQKWLAFGAAAINAFNPQFIFISASINNDNLVNFAGALGVWVLLRLWRGQLTNSMAIAAGVVLGIAALSKLSGLVLAPLAGIATIVGAWRCRSVRALVRTGAGMIATAAVVAGWWYARNWTLYGDALGLKGMFAVLAPRTQGPTLHELLGRVEGVWKSSWAVFGWFNVLADAWVYALYTGLALIALGGLVRLALRKKKPVFSTENGFLDLSALALLGLWWLVLLISLLTWAQLRYPQGRMLFPAISAASVLLMVGLAEWLPRRAAPALVASLASGMFFPAALLPFQTIAPAYAMPSVPAETLAAIQQPVQFDFRYARLRAYELDRDSFYPGETIGLTLYWEAIAPTPTDYSVFVHLVDEYDLIIAQRDTYPGQGNVLTSEWSPGAIIRDVHQLQVPSTAPAPCRCRLLVGLYDFATKKRLPVNDSASSDSVVLSTINLTPRVSGTGIPNPVFFSLDDQVALIGFQLDRRAVRPGEAIRLKLYWQGLSTMREDYTVFTHLENDLGGRYAQEDAEPQKGNAPTSRWKPGEIVEDTYTLVVSPQAPAGSYTLWVGMYQGETGKRLKAGGSDAGIVVAKVRVSH